MSARVLSAAAERSWLGQGLLDGQPLIVLMAARNLLSDHRRNLPLDPVNPTGLPANMLDHEPSPVTLTPGFTAKNPQTVTAIIDEYMAGVDLTPADKRWLDLGRRLGVPEAVLEVISDMILIEAHAPEVLKRFEEEDKKGPNH